MGTLYWKKDFMVQENEESIEGVTDGIRREIVQVNGSITTFHDVTLGTGNGLALSVTRPRDSGSTVISQGLRLTLWNYAQQTPFVFRNGFGIVATFANLATDRQLADGTPKPEGLSGDTFAPAIAFEDVKGNIAATTLQMRDINISGKRGGMLNFPRATRIAGYPTEITQAAFDEIFDSGRSRVFTLATYVNFPMESKESTLEVSVLGQESISANFAFDSNYFFMIPGIYGIRLNLGTVNQSASVASGYTVSVVLRDVSIYSL